jgi:hypothetical protein
MAALGMKEESRLLLDDANAAFPGNEAQIQKRRRQLEPNQALTVGPDKQYRCIFQALGIAWDGAEILVDPGVYSEPPLILSKPVTLRSSKPVSVAETLSEESSASTHIRPEIRVVDNYSAVTCNAECSVTPVRTVGFKIVCQDRPENSYHALDVGSGLVVIHNTILTSSSGPVMTLQDSPLQQMSLFVLPVKSDKPS